VIDRILIRVDCSRNVGLGHLMRGVALAEAAHQRELHTQVVVDPEIPSTVRAGLGATARVVGTEDEWHDDIGPHDVVIFDGYDFGLDDHTAARQRGARVAAIDDQGRGDYQVDVLINQNIVRAPPFKVPGHAKVLLGPEYALVRREFLDYRRKRGASGSQLLVTMGGSDTAGLTVSVVEIALEEGCFDRVRALLGPAAIPPELPDDVSLVRDPPSVAAEFDSSDGVVSAAGTTTWELLSMGVPAVLIEVAENQRYVGRPVSERGAALFAGSLPLDPDKLRACLRALASPATRSRLSRRALDTVDGLGPERVLDALLDVGSRS
jgi:UDP-2,4-diacetamido-2,4,6-trideoxy-beta-L-altropyranose hydrolase